MYILRAVRAVISSVRGDCRLEPSALVPWPTLAVANRKSARLHVDRRRQSQFSVHEPGGLLRPIRFSLAGFRHEGPRF